MGKKINNVSPTDIAKVKISRLVSLGLTGRKLRAEVEPILEEFKAAILDNQDARVKRLEKDSQDLRTLKKILK